MGNNETQINIAVNEKMLAQIEELRDKERWSRRQLLMVALEYYLKLRGYPKDEER